MNNKYDYAILIGRFQPFHNGHKAILERATTIANNIIVLVGSSNAPRSIKNPFTFEERKRMILWNTDASIYPLEDFKYNDQKWITNVQKVVSSIIYNCSGDTCSNKKIAIVGLNKDDSTSYLTWFPTWDFVEVSHIDQHGLDATSIRDILFTEKPLTFLKGVVPYTTYDFLKEAKELPYWQELVAEYKFIASYKKAYEASPYPPTFVTVDAVVIQDGHVLLIKRKKFPGKGLWALPGGFINQNEKLVDASVRELREETGLKVPAPVLRGSILHSMVFDDPGRSLRGRTITHAYLFALKSVGELPHVKGGDDADKAKWVSIAELKESMMFEDHYAIIQQALDKYTNNG